MGDLIVWFRFHSLEFWLVHQYLDQVCDTICRIHKVDHLHHNILHHPFDTIVDWEAYCWKTVNLPQLD